MFGREDQTTTRLYSIPVGSMAFNCGIPYDVKLESDPFEWLPFEEGDVLVVINTGRECDIWAEAFHSRHGLVKIDRHAIVQTRDMTNG